jgi:hypothetical protein
VRYLLLLLACAHKPALPPPSAARPRMQRIVLQLDAPLSTRESHTGDAFTARVINHGVREDTRVGGVVAEAHRGSREREPMLRLKVKWLQRGRCRVPLSAHISSAETRDVSEPTGDSWRGGGIVGAVTGGVLLAMPGAVSGFGMGFAGGAVHEARNLGTDTVLPAGALMTLALEAPIPSCP